MRRQSSYKQRKNKSGGAGTPSPGGGGGGGGNKGGARRTSKHRKKSQRSVDRQSSLSASNSDLIIPDLDDSFVMEDVGVEHDDSSSSSDPSKPRDASVMRASAIKRELKSYGVSTNSIMEKNQLVNALEEIWQQGDLPQNTEDDSDDDIVVANSEEDVPVLSDHSGDDDDDGVPVLSDDEDERFLVSKISSPPTSPLRSTTEAPTETTTETAPSPKDVSPLPSPPPPDDVPPTANEETSPPSTTLAQESLTNALDNAPALFTNDDDSGGDVIVVPTNPSRSTDDSPVAEEPTSETSPSPSSAASPSFAPLEEEHSADEPPVVVEEPTEKTSPSPANDDGSESPSTVPTSVSPEEVLTNVVDNAPTLFANDEEEYDAIDPPVVEPSPSTTNNDGGTTPPPVPPEEVLTNVVDNAPTLFAEDDDGDGRVAPTSPSRSTEDDRVVDQSTANTETSPPSKNDEAASPLVPTRVSPDESPTSAIDDPSSAHKDVDDDENGNETVVPTSPIANDDTIDTVVPTSPLRSMENEPTANDDDKDKTVVPTGPLRATTDNPNSSDGEDDEFVLRKAASPRPVRNNKKSDDDGNPRDLFILTSPSALIPPDHDDEDKDKENKTNDVSFPPPKTFSPVTTPSPKPSTDDRPSTAADEKLSTPAVRSNATSPPPPPTTNRYASPSSSFDPSPIVFQPLSQPFLPNAALNNDAVPPPLARANRIEGEDVEEEDSVPTKVPNALRRSSASSSGLNLAGLWRPGSEQQLRHAPATTAVNPLQSQQQQPMLVPSFGDATTNDHDGDYVKRFVVPTSSSRRTLPTVPPTPPQDSTPRTPRTADDDESTEVGLPIDDAGGGSPFAQRPQTDWSGGDHQDFSFDFLPPSNNNVRTPWTDQAQSFDFSVPSNNNNARTPQEDQTQSFDFSVPSNFSASFHPGGGSYREGNDDDDDDGSVCKYRSPDFRFDFAMDKGYRKQRRSKTTPTNRRRNGDRSTPRTNAHETKGDKNETNFKFDFAVDKVAQQQHHNAAMMDERRNGDQPTPRTDKEDTKDAGEEKGTEIVGRENEKDDRINYISSLLESIKDDGGDRFDGMLDDLEGLDRATSDVDDVWKMNTDHEALNAVEHESDEEETETEEEEEKSIEEERAVLAAKHTLLGEEREKQNSPSNARNVVVAPRHRKRSSAICRRNTVCEQCVVQ